MREGSDTPTNLAKISFSYPLYNIDSPKGFEKAFWAIYVGLGKFNWVDS